MNHIQYQSSCDFERFALQARKMQLEIEEMALCEVMAWRMFGIDAEFHYMQGELVVMITIESDKKVVDI